LLSGALGALQAHGVSPDHITVVRVPGSFEIPVACKRLAFSRHYDGVVAVGTLIRGDTDHYDLIAKEVTSGIQRVMMESGVPVTFGVITANNMEQAMARSGSKAGNKGAEAATAAVELANVLPLIE
ncbi:MAG: 6,7-dimethyl-8-ribityllumazine synthase, partial [Deltaproteobacteria bacterium]|nr:6,7-dimethyl-8-ribityllumazine synthase [Deltaproteobacteria bacterium]